jgi:PhnB protein
MRPAFFVLIMRTEHHSPDPREKAMSAKRKVKEVQGREVQGKEVQSEQYAADILGGLTPYLQVDGASAASEFYQQAFGAEEVFRYPVDEQGRTMHIHLHINGSSLMLSDSFPEHGHAAETPQGYNLTLQVGDADAAAKRAIEAGATEVLPVQDMFWGDRYGQLRDPFGVLWAINQPSNQRLIKRPKS